MPRRRRAAILLLVVVGMAGVAGLRYSPLSLPVRPARTSTVATTDVKTFAAVVERVRAGENYYEAMGAELRQHDYPTRDSFNWRTPLHLSALALAPRGLWRSVLTAVLVALYVAAMMTVRTRRAVFAANLLTLGVLVITAAQDAIFVSEAWAGALIGLSVCAFALERRPIGVGLALAALFVRELTAPYCVACTIVALLERRWREVSAWAVGALAYAAYYAWHVAQVAAHRLPSDFAHGESWLTLLGLPFLQVTLQKLGWFALLPPPLSALALAILVAGLLAPETPRHLRVASASFAAFFLVAGFPFNDYWGFIAAPVWAITCGYGVGAIAEAITTLRTPATSSSS